MGDGIRRAGVPRPRLTPDLAETVALLEAAGAVGVWGNHDIGLVLDPDPALRAALPPETLAYMGRLAARLAVTPEIHASHIEPWRDPTDVLYAYYNDDGPPVDAGRVARTFAAIAQPIAVSSTRVPAMVHGSPADPASAMSSASGVTSSSPAP